MSHTHAYRFAVNYAKFILIFSYLFLLVMDAMKTNSPQVPTLLTNCIACVWLGLIDSIYLTSVVQMTKCPCKIYQHCLVRPKTG